MSQKSKSEVVAGNMYVGEVLNIEQICGEVKEREQRIGIFTSLTSPCCSASTPLFNECNTPRRKSVAVVMKTLYSDFVVREMCAFHNHGKPLELNTANYLVTDVNENNNKVKCAHTLIKKETGKNVTNMKRERCTDVEEVASANDFMSEHNLSQATNISINNNKGSSCQKNNSNNDNSDVNCVKSECDDGNNDEFINDIKQTLTPLLSEADLQRVVEFVSENKNNKNSKNRSKSSITLLDTVTLDKTKRTSVHNAIKSCMLRQFISSTTNGMICITIANAAMRREEERRSRPIRTRSFTHFTLYKENLDSAQVFRALARLLHVRTRQFSYCGTKDKRAITLQRVAIQDVEPNRLAFIINNQRVSPHGTIRVCDFTIERSSLKLGDAMGNYFTIVLRCLPTSLCSKNNKINNNSNTFNENNFKNSPNVAALKETEALLASSGVINYYGPQRFGTTSILTSDIGVALLQGNYHNALKLIFASRACIVPAMQSVVDMVASHDYISALAHTPHYCLQERDMLKYLIDQPNDLQGAFRVLPRTLAMLYFHAVQSLIWNTIASQRIRCHECIRYNSEDTYSMNQHSENTEVENKSLVSEDKKNNGNKNCALRTKVEVGDLVLESVYKKRTRCFATHTELEQKECNNGEICDTDSCTNVMVERKDMTEQVERIEENCSVDNGSSNNIKEIFDHATPKGDEDEDDTDSESYGEKSKLPSVHCLSAEDDLSVFDLTDVLLPLPGPDVDLEYPKSAGCTYADYKEIMSKWGVLTALLNVEIDDENSTDKRERNSSNKVKIIQVNNALVKTFHFHGAYRSLCVKPQNIEIYSDSVDGWRTPITRTDLEQINVKCTDSNIEKDNSCSLCANVTETIVNSHNLVDGKEIAGTSNNTTGDEVNNSSNDGGEEKVDVIVCKFSLPAGSYATSVLREIAIVCPDNQHTTSPKQ